MNNFFDKKLLNNNGKVVGTEPKVKKTFFSGVTVTCFVNFHGDGKNMWTAFKKSNHPEYTPNRYINQCSSLYELFGKMKEKGLLAK